MVQPVILVGDPIIKGNIARTHGKKRFSSVVRGQNKGNPLRAGAEQVTDIVADIVAQGVLGGIVQTDTLDIVDILLADRIPGPSRAVTAPQVQAPEAFVV